MQEVRRVKPRHRDAERDQHQRVGHLSGKLQRVGQPDRRVPPLPQEQRAQNRARGLDAQITGWAKFPFADHRNRPSP